MPRVERVVFQNLAITQFVMPFATVIKQEWLPLCTHEIALGPYSDVEGVSACLTTFLILKNAVFLDVTSCGSCQKRRFGGT
jgi:hypothetical protein